MIDMKHTLHLGILILMLIASVPIHAAPIVIKTSVTLIEKHKVDSFLNGRSPISIDRYDSPHLDSIGPVEHVLFRKAVLLGGLEATFVDFIVPNSQRARISVFDGTVLGSGTAHWHIYFNELKDHLLESDAVIAGGGYEKGLYVTHKNKDYFTIKSRGDLKKLSAVSSNGWEVDWATLSSLELANLFSAPTRALQFKMIDGNRAAFTLQDFSNLPDLSIEEQGVRLYPIPGVKVLLNGTRHFFINKDSPDSYAVFESLQKGLRILKERGEIKRAMIESGVMNKAVANWIPLNSQM